MIMSEQKRYKLKIGKYGFYFYDNTFTKDMTLKEVLNRLNYTFTDNIIKCTIISNDRKEIYELKRKLKRYE